jgi:hypothetical protein
MFASARCLVAASNNQSQSQIKSYITTGSQSSWCQAPIWDPRPIFTILSLTIFRQLRVCWCGAPCLTKSRVCSFQFLPGITTELMSLFYCLYFWDSPKPGGPGSCIYFPQEPYRHLWADCLDNVGSLTSHNPIGLQGLLRGLFTFYRVAQLYPRAF